MDEAKLDKLNANNYRHWSLRVQGVLEVKGCWSAIDPGFNDEEEITDKQKKIDHLAKSIFYLSVNDESLDDIIDCKTAKEIWETLQQIHTQYDTWHGLLLVRDFVNMQKQSSQSIGDYLMQRNALYNKVKNAGFEFNEKAIAGFALLGLPSEYEYVTRNIRADNDDLQMTKIKAKLLEEERRIQGSQSILNDDTKALNTKQSAGEKSKGARQKHNPAKSVHRRRSSDKPPQSHQFLRCFSCLEFGHISQECPVKTQGRNLEPIGGNSVAKLVTEQQNKDLKSHENHADK